MIGVTPRAFSGLIVDSGEDVTVPLAIDDATDLRQRKYLSFGGYGRLKPGVSIEQARAQWKALWPSIQAATEPEGYTGARRARFYARKSDLESAATGQAYLRYRLKQPLTILMALVGMVLLIACVNLANLMLARAAGRRHELAVRTALGFVVAIWTSRVLLTTMWTGAVPLVLDPAPDARVLAFTIAIAILTGLLFGLAPAWRVARTDPADALRQNTRSVRGAGFLGRALVSGQVALSMVVVLAAALLVHSLRNMQTVNPGFDRHGVLVMQLLAQPGRQLTSNFGPYYREMAERVSRLPGVLSVSYSNVGPVNRGEAKAPIAADGSLEAPEQPATDFIGPGFFQTIGMRVLAGREFTWADDQTAAPVAVISQSLAARLFPGRDPAGQYIDFNPGVNQKRLRVIGVVNSASLWRIQSREPKAVYQALLQSGPLSPMLDIRTFGDPLSVATAARKIVESMGHDYPLYIQTLEQRMDRMTVDERMVAWLSVFFGGLALLLASIGLYGLMAYSVTQRKGEIGIRMALGAERGRVVVLVLGEVIVLVAVGIAVGIPVALVASKTVSAMLFGLSATDSATMFAATATLFSVALFAGYLPARQASRIDPMTALCMD